MNSVRSRLFVSVLFAFVAVSLLPRVRAVDVFREGFENGLGNWTVEGGLWQVGVPKAAGGPAPFAGANVAGTGLNGNYGATYDARLISPVFVAPAAAESPRFTYYYWYQIGANDYGQLQVRVAGGDWQDVPGEHLTEASGGSWARRSVDLRAYAGQTMQVAFRFFAKANNSVGDFALGWFIDEAALETGSMAFASPDGFEKGFGDWSAEGGIWQVGTPSGPGAPSPYAGANVAGTILAGNNYGTIHDARLVSPEFTVLPAEESPRFTYHYWYDIGGNDYGQLQIRAGGGAWQDVPGERLTEAGKSWARRSVDLRPFAGQTVQVGFHLVSDYQNRVGDLGRGWFIDEVALESGPMNFNAVEGFESGFGDWSVEGGVWQAGSPTGVGAPAAFQGTNVAGTILNGNYGTIHDARLVTPEFTVVAADQSPRFSYRYWYDMGGLDYGQLQVRKVGGDWQDVPGERLTEAGHAWARRSVDLRPYAGQNIQFAFHLVSDFQNRAGDLGLGWYVDNVAVETGAIPYPFPDGFESGFGNWSAEGGVWQIGVPSGPGAPSPFEGKSVAATILDGNYGTIHDARLVSPEFVVPAATEFPRFTYQYWYDFGILDYAQLQIRLVGGAWQDVAGEHLAGAGHSWTRRSLDLRGFAGQAVQVGFRLVSDFQNRGGDFGLGWYIDAVKLETGLSVLGASEGFEGSTTGWSVEGGVWQLGVPSGAGAPASFEGTNVAGTIIGGNYPDNADARLVSPEFLVPPAAQAPQISFEHWRAMQNLDRGRVEISIAGGVWGPISTNYTLTDANWKRGAIDLAPYGGQPARLAWHFTSDSSVNALGWYVDDVRLGTLEPVELTLGAATSGTFAASGSRALYVVNIPPGGHLLVKLDDADNGGVNEVYVRRGQVPTAGAYDYRSTTSKADQALFASDVPAGVYYILAVGAAVPTNGSNFQIKASFSAGIAVAAVTPARAGNGYPAVFEIAGAGFDKTARVELRTNATVAATGTTHFIAGNALRADFTPSAVPAGVYQLTVAQGTNSASLPVEIVEGGIPRFEAHMTLPLGFGRHAPATIYVDYANTGTVAMPSPLLVVYGSEKAMLTLDPKLSTRGLWATARPPGLTDTVEFLASGTTPGLLQPGEHNRVRVYYSGLLRPWDFTHSSVQFQLGMIDPRDTTPVNWVDFKSALRPPLLGATAWDFIWTNFLSAVGVTWGDYIATLAGNAKYLGGLGVNVVNAQDLFAFQMAQANGLNPAGALASSIDAAVEQPGVALTFQREYRLPLSARLRTGILGWGWRHNWDYLRQFDGDGRVVITGPSGRDRIFQPDSRGGFFAEAGEYGQLTDLGLGRYELRESNGVRLDFRPDGRLDFVVDLNGNSVTCGYEGTLLTRLTHSSGEALQLAYTGGLLASVTDSAGRSALYSYDGSQQLVSVARFGSNTVAYGYRPGDGTAAQHALASITDATGVQETFVYDERGRLAARGRTGGAETVRFTYDGSGGCVATDASGRAIKFDFEQHGLLAKIEGPLGDAQRLGYDDNLNLASLRAEDGRGFQLNHDLAGHLTRVVDPLGHAVSASYLRYGRPVQFVDALNQTTRFGYDTNSNLISFSYPNNSREGYAVSPAGQLTILTNRRGATITLTRDSSGRITQKALPEGRVFGFAYDRRGNLTNVTDSRLGATRLAYTERDLLQSVTYPDGRGFAYQYDGAGRRTRRTGDDGYVLEYAYNAAGRLESVLHPGDARPLIRYAYDSSGYLIREDKGNGSWTTYDYDGGGLLARVVNFATNGLAVSHFDYSYGLDGLVSTASSGGVTSYSYDLLGQIIGASYPDGREVSYTYDANGNRTLVKDGKAAVSFVVNGLNQYVLAGTNAFTYDADGNLVGRADAGGPVTLSYNSENRLIHLSSATEGDWEFEYDAFGNRVSSTHNGVVVSHCVFDLRGWGEAAAEYDNAGALIARYVNGLGLVAAVDGVNRALFYNFDGQGNTREITGDGGAVVNAYDYDVFGAIRASQEGWSNHFTFVGREGVMAGPAGLFDMRARFYDPTLGRFTSADPRGLAGGLNLYTYAANVPTLYADPSGLNPALQLEAAPFVYNGMYQEMGVGYDKQLGAATQDESGAAMIRLMNQRDADATKREAGMVVAKAAVETTELGDLGEDESGILARLAQLYYTKVFHTTEHISLKTQFRILWPNYPQDIAKFWQTLSDIGHAIVAAFDPNGLTGPGGYGARNYVPFDQALPYSIAFQNLTNATAPAQVVVIQNSLSTNLDLASFEFTSVGFGDYMFAIPPGSQHYEHTERIVVNGVELDVSIEAKLDYLNRSVQVEFDSLIPDTGLPPTVDLGFLPPEDGTGRGNGHIDYLVRPVAGLATGAEIRNVAVVAFDPLAGGPAFRTDLSDPLNPNSPPSTDRQALVTIDADPPAGSVAALPTNSVSASFLVSWAGTDQGAGVTGYDVYVRTDNGDWAVWLNDTAQTSASWSGASGHAYGFYAVARDGAGLSQSPPLAGSPAQASTTVSGPVSFFRNIGADGQNVDLEFVGIPGEHWTIQGAPQLNGQWQNRAEVTIDASGSAHFSELRPTTGNVFYRAVRQ